MARPVSSSIVSSIKMALGVMVLLSGQTTVLAADSQIELVGDYRYAYHAPETASEAQEVACREALRLAISTAPLLREHTAGLVDSELLKRYVHTLATDHVLNRRIVEQYVKGRTVYCKVAASFEAGDFPVVLAAQVSGTAEPEASHQNRALRILNITEAQDGTIAIVYQARKRLDWISTAYDGSLREAADIMIDFRDAQGTVVRTDRYPARRTASGEDVLNPGEIRTLKVHKPLNAATYRVWVMR